MRPQGKPPNWHDLLSGLKGKQESLCFSSSQDGQLKGVCWEGGVTETKVMIYKANLDFCFLLFVISKVIEMAVCLR